MTYGGAPRVPEHRAILNLIFSLVSPDGAWPTYRTVDLYLDRQLHIADTQAALLAIPEALLVRPWRATGYYDTDEIRLTLAGVAECDGGPEDLDALAAFLRWAANREQAAPISDAEFVVTSAEYCQEIGLRLGEEPDVSAAGPANAEAQPVDPEIEKTRHAMTRLRLLAGMAPRFWTSVGYPTDKPWLWQITVDRRLLRDYRDIHGHDQLLAKEAAARDALATWAAYGSSGVHDEEHEPDDGSASWVLTDHPDAGPGPSDTTTEAPVPDAAEAAPGPQPGTATTDAPASPAATVTGADTLVTLLRPEIAAQCSAAFTERRYDDAIFEAFRCVESAVQQRTGLTDVIGRKLLSAAFVDDGPRRISVSRREGDRERMFQMFDGAIGLIRGDRAHKNKPSLVCRTPNECLRLLAHASALLDLLDRDIATAPTVVGFTQLAETLVLRVKRATPGTRVLIDEKRCDVVQRTPETITVSITGVPTGEHEIVLVDGSLQSPATPIWLTRTPGQTNWYRVEEINIALYADPQCTRLLDASGVSLATLESGLRSQRIVATRTAYEPGDYVSWQWDTSTTLTDAWARGRAGERAYLVFNSSTLFNGVPQSAAHEPRILRVSLEPPLVKVRVGEKPPVRALIWKTDGTATWSEPIDDPAIVTDSITNVAYNRGTVTALRPGPCALRLAHEGHYTETLVEVAAHPRGTVADWLTALPPVAGLAWSTSGLLITTREPQIWRVNAQTGQLEIAAGIPVQPPLYTGCDTIAVAGNDDVAVLLYGQPDIFVLPANSNYAGSRVVAKPDPDATITALAWHGADLIVAMHTGTLWRITPDGTVTLLGTTPGTVYRLAADQDPATLLGLSAGDAQWLWRIDLAHPDRPTDLLAHTPPNLLSSITAAPSGIYATDFHKGLLLRL